MKNREKIKGAIIVWVVMMITATVMGCGDNTKKLSNRTESAVSNSVAEEPGNTENKELNSEMSLCDEKQQITETEIFYKGEQVRLGDIKLTINGMREQENGVLLDPEPGNTYKVLNIKLENTGKMSIPISTMMMFYLRDNSYNRYCVSLTCGTGGNIGKALNPRSTMEGEIAFEINKEAKDLKLVFEPGVFGQAIIDL